MRQSRTPWLIAPLNSKAHDRAGFSCGAIELDRYIREHASQDMKRDVARVFVATDAEAPTVCGYYSLSATSFQRDNLPADQAKRLPRYPVPAALLGRLAVDDGMKGKGLGAFLLMDALNRILLATQTLAVHAVIVEAKDNEVAAFYRKYGFIQFDQDDARLFMPMATIRKLADG
ncbi:GNAT family N-acetyltransferase [Pararhodospirillum oryzae]|uniref:N-acetyltransferase n=1 Tax=Pararhodospirillum oryzae TaxID=478448 RepID=A0A512H842_9PROT|nr:GNAT family N-acetyltransferase [Pararhodospirillum oryzae]GEO81598.1 N-acetyltransferase [Pararhodospirillum oryzae]